MSFHDPHRLTLTTEDSVSFSVQLASPLLRAFALGIDIMVILGTLSLVRILLILFKLLGPDAYIAINVLVTFVVSIGYFMLLEWIWSGQTIGKRIMGIRVMDASARRLSSSQIVIRNLFRSLDMLPYFYFVGGCVSMCSKRFQRLGDHVADTLVVRTRRRPHPEIRNLPPMKFNSLKKYPRLEASLRRELGPQEAELLARALLRRDELSPEARLDVFHQLASHLQSQFKFPPEILATSDEIFIRNCVDTLYRNLKEF
ncbi:RDD family protein [Kiritimatiellota bacterium B12222]|nr:RDD family protein [Kiritimatiellota bacterium B12222]